MKNARILLVSIAIIGIVSATIAFKANRGNRTYYVTNSYAAPATSMILKGLIVDVGPRVYWTTTSGAPAYNYSSIVFGL